MFRGTTPTLKFELPFDTAFINTVWITFAQNNKEIFTVKTDACELNENVITAKLTQKQTLQLKGSYEVEIQIRILTNENDALVSHVIKAFVNKILKDGEIS